MWQEVAPLFQTHRVGPGIDLVMTRFNNASPYVAGGLFLASIILLAWPQRRIDMRAVKNDAAAGPAAQAASPGAAQAQAQVQVQGQSLARTSSSAGVAEATKGA
jgi:hypothetical protein